MARGKRGKCIYCGRHCAMSREHWMPQGFGGFRGFEPLDDRVCQVCNGKIGRLEDQFLRAGPNAYFRHLLGLSDPDRDPQYHGAAGAPPITTTMRIKGMDFDLAGEIEPSMERKMRVARQIILRKGEKLHRITVPSSWKTSADLRRRLESEDLLDADPVYSFRVTEEHIAWLSEVLGRKLGMEPNPIESRTWKAQAKTVFQVNDRYFRSIAKIAFHHTLKYVSAVRGDESEFEAVRNFIMNGIGKVDDFIYESERPFVARMRAGYAPIHWCHIILSDRNEFEFHSRCHFFVGPGCSSPHYIVRLGRNPVPIAGGRSVFCHIFRYNMDPPYAPGEVQRVNVIPISI